jgi:hypothetical protein
MQMCRTFSGGAVCSSSDQAGMQVYTPIVYPHSVPEELKLHFWLVMQQTIEGELEIHGS